MAIIRCPKGHFYDNSKYDECPSCSKVSSGPRWQMENDKTVSLESFGAFDTKTVHLTAAEQPKQSVTGSWDSEKTVSLSGYESTQLPVGWLVCTAGNMKGKDYRLYAGFNWIGRNLDSDLCIQDFEISREKHCAVVYDEKSGKFFLTPGSGPLTYLKEETVQKAVVLEDGDKIRIGSSTLVFVAFCKGERTWQNM